MKDLNKNVLRYVYREEYYSTRYERGTKKKSESPTGIEPMASQIPVGRSNQLSYETLAVSWAIH